MTSSLATGFLKTATSGNDQLLHVWASCDMIKQTTNTDVAPTHQEYYYFLMSTAEKLDDSIIDNYTSQEVNMVKTDFLHPYSYTDDNYPKELDLSSYMGARGMDVDMIHDVLICNKALQQVKPRLKEQARRSPREPIC